MIDLKIAIKNFQDLPPGELTADFSYSGWRTRTVADTAVQEAIRFFHLGRFEIAEGGKLQVSVPDFASDPVLNRTVQLGMLEITVEQDRGRRTLGRLVVVSSARANQLVKPAQHEPNHNPGNTGLLLPQGNLPVTGEYEDPIQLQFVSNPI